jgi:ferritin-like metal-binding protein YciE
MMLKRRKRLLREVFTGPSSPFAAKSLKIITLGQEHPGGVVVASRQVEVNEMQTLNELFEETVRDIYYAEKKILKALPKMAKKATSASLAAAFEAHIEETEGQVERLEEIFDLLGKAPRGKTCPAIDGIIEEGQEIMKDAEDDTVRDAGMLAAAQAVEHYEISRYGTLKAWADKLGMTDAASLLDQTLQEEKATDEKLTALAESEINVEAEAKEGAAQEPRGRKAAQGKRRS